MSDKDKGFASMDKDKVRDIAHKGGEARKEQLGPEGYAELGRKGGSASHNNDNKGSKKNKEDEDKNDRGNHKK